MARSPDGKETASIEVRLIPGQCGLSQVIDGRGALQTRKMRSPRQPPQGRVGNGSQPVACVDKEVQVALTDDDGHRDGPSAEFDV